MSIRNVVIVHLLCPHRRLFVSILLIMHDLTRLTSDQELETSSSMSSVVFFCREAYGTLFLFRLFLFFDG